MGEEYKQGFSDGYTTAVQNIKAETDKPPYIDINGVIKAFDGKIGINKAGQILRAVRHTCNGGKLDSCSIVLRSEFEYWLTIVDAKYLARLGDHRNEK